MSMILIEQAPVADAALPLQEFKDHLRLGTGFTDDGAQDALLKRLIRAGIAGIESRISKMLIQRAFVYTVENWRDPGDQTLPVAPVQSITSVTLLDVLGTPTVVDPTRYVLVRDTHRPRLAASGVLLPNIPIDGTAEIIFQAGFGPVWADVPADLQQAVMLLAGHYHEHRVEADTGTMPFGVSALTERWRTIRVLGGGVL
jgi:uncharacterized phiE125 gp8 family phage protein